MHPVAFLPLGPLPATLRLLEDESIAQGFTMITRLRSEWESGVNRFERPGEILLGAFRGDRLIGTGGLNVDPYFNDPATGRPRHIYVLDAERRDGVGKALVDRLLMHAKAHFASVRLWTGQASAFYESLGFIRVDVEKATHVRSTTSIRTFADRPRRLSLVRS